MSQRTPSAWAAMSISVVAGGRCAAPAAKALSCSDVRPRREVGVPAAGDDRLADLGRKAAGSLARSSAAALDEALGVLGQPRVVGADVVGYEVDEQPHAPFGQGGPRRFGEAGLAAEAPGDLDSGGSEYAEPMTSASPRSGSAARERRHLLGRPRNAKFGAEPGWRCHTPISHTVSTPRRGDAVPLRRRAPFASVARRAPPACRRRRARRPCSARR